MSFTLKNVIPNILGQNLFLTASIALAVLGITLMMMMMMMMMTRTFFEISLKINKSVKRITLMMMMMTQNFF